MSDAFRRSYAFAESGLRLGSLCSVRGFTGRSLPMYIISLEDRILLDSKSTVLLILRDGQEGAFSEALMQILCPIFT